MDNKVFLRNEFSDSVNFFKINQKIIDWNYEDIYGESCIKKHTGHFAYVKIKISNNEDEFSHQLINQLSDDEMPVVYLNEIIKTFNFFISYLFGIKGERLKLKIEIVDGTFHYVESRPKDFQTATIHAICNCFDKTLWKISEAELQTINSCKINNKNNSW